MRTARDRHQMAADIGAYFVLSHGSVAAASADAAAIASRTDRSRRTDRCAMNAIATASAAGISG